MDDPWGSPWTTADADKDHRPPSPAKSDLEPPPRAFLSAHGSPRIPTISGQSPWADDDNFGDWAAPDAPVPAQSGWGDGWKTPDAKLTLPSEDDFGTASPIALPGSIALSKGAGASTLRQPSPDPWSAEFAAQTPSNESLKPPRLVVDAPPITHAQDSIDTLSPVWGVEDDEFPKGSSTNAAGDEVEESPQSIRTPEETEEKKDDNGTTDAGVIEDRGRRRSNSIKDTRKSRSRSRSYSSGESDHDGQWQDSPITSIDEDTRARQQLTRSASGKVQELVTKFDGLARAASQEPPAIRRERSKSSLRVADKQDALSDAGDFGEFEDVEPDQAPAPSPPHRTQTPEPSYIPPGSVGSASPETPHPLSPCSATSQHPTKLPSVAFNVDMGGIDKLFSFLKPPVEDGHVEPDQDVPERIITDSFTNISERKTWYRISRLGSSRMHNAGDDENYRRVAWPTSAIHQDTIQIVRRWMEEDSIAGRVTLGGGAFKTQKNMFGWDSSAEPVGLDAIFGKKKSHSRASSLQQLQMPSYSPPSTGTFPKKPYTSLQNPTPRPSSMIIPPVASFGWSSSPTASQLEQAPSSDPIVPSLIPAPFPQGPSTPTFQPAPAYSTSLSNTTKPRRTVPIAELEDESSNDEEWGEMISSPLSPPAASRLENLNADSTGHPHKPDTTQQDVPVINTLPAKADSSGLSGSLAMAPVTNDPWGSIDLSLFDTSTGGQTKDSPPSQSQGSIFEVSLFPATPAEPATTAPTASKDTLPSGSKTRIPDHHATTAVPLSPMSTTALSPGTSAGKTPSAHMQQGQHDDAVARILSNLPDLSYMLR